MYCEKKNFIFNAAVKLFSEKSYDVATTRELSSAAGVNDATIYHYFKNKEEILNEIISEFNTVFRKYLVRRKQIDEFSKTDSPEQLLRRLIPKYEKEDLQFVSRAYKIICMEQFKNDKAGEIIKALIYQETADRFRYALEKLIEAGKIPANDVDLLSAVWAGTMFSSTVYSLNAAPLIDAQVLIAAGEFFIELAVNGLLYAKNAVMT